MAWLYVPDTRGLSSASTEPLGAVLARSVTWKGKPRQSRYWLATWSKGGWILRLSGVTYEPLTLARGVASWISSLRDTRVSQSLLQVCGAGPTTIDGSGRTLRASSERSSPRSYSLKTSQPTLPGLSLECSLTLPRSGSMRNGVVFARQRLAPPMSVTGFSGLLPTPTACDSKASGSAGYSTDSGRHAGTTLWDAVVRGHRKLPTPTASDGKSGAGNAAMRQGGESLRDCLSGSGRRLNPRFLEWMMGIPEGWLELK